MSYGSISTGRRINHLGTTLFNVGLGQYAMSHLSMPPSSGKIWIPMTRAEAKIHRPDITGSKVKNYDWQPKGTSLRGSFRDSNISYRGKRSSYRRGEWEEHKLRRPVEGKYSQPSPADIHYHQKSQSRRGLGKATLGGGMRLLGKGLMIVSLGTYTKWMYDDPSIDTVGQIALDMTGYHLFKPLAEGATSKPGLDYNNVTLNFGTFL